MVNIGFRSDLGLSMTETLVRLSFNFILDRFIYYKECAHEHICDEHNKETTLPILHSFYSGHAGEQVRMLCDIQANDGFETSDLLSDW